MVQDAADLAIKHADILAAPGHLQSQQLFDRQAEGMLLVHRRDIVQPVEIGDRLQIGLVLDQLLGAAMQKPDMGIDAGDDFAVQIQDQPQHAMGGRMLGPEIQGQLRLFGRAVRGFGGDVFDRYAGHGFFPVSPEVASGAIAAFSSPGRICGAPSQGLMKSKSRNSCTSCTG